MIISAASWERMYKSGLVAILATNYEQFNTDYQKYDIKQGFGNLHLFKTNYPWHYCTNKELKERLKEMPTKGVMDTIYVIDEADNVFPARDYGKQEQTEILKGLTQHGKLRNIILYTFQLGDPNEPLLGVDRILRGLTRVKITIDYFDKKNWTLIYTMMNYLRNVEPQQGVIRNLDKYLDYWDTNERVV